MHLHHFFHFGISLLSAAPGKQVKRSTNGGIIYLDAV